MIFQDMDAFIAAIIYLTIFIIIFSFILNIIILRWRASKWFESNRWGPPIIISVVWLVLNFTINWFLPQFGFIIVIIVNIIVGTILVMIFYDRGFGKSLAFIIVVQIIVFIILIIVIFIVVIILVMLYIV